MGYPKKNPNNSVEDIELFVCWGKTLWKFLEVIKKEERSAIFSGDQEKIVWNFRECWFLAFKFSRVQDSFAELSEKALICSEFSKSK